MPLFDKPTFNHPLGPEARDVIRETKSRQFLAPETETAYGAESHFYSLFAPSRKTAPKKVDVQSLRGAKFSPRSTRGRPATAAPKQIGRFSTALVNRLLKWGYLAPDTEGNIRATGLGKRALTWAEKGEERDARRAQEEKAAARAKARADAAVAKRQAKLDAMTPEKRAKFLEAEEESGAVHAARIAAAGRTRARVLAKRQAREAKRAARYARHAAKKAAAERDQSSVEGTDTAAPVASRAEHVEQRAAYLRRMELDVVAAREAHLASVTPKGDSVIIPMPPADLLPPMVREATPASSQAMQGANLLDDEVRRADPIFEALFAPVVQPVDPRAALDTPDLINFATVHLEYDR